MFVEFILPFVIVGLPLAAIRELVSASREGFSIKFLFAFSLWVAAELLFVLMWAGFITDGK